MYNDNIRTDSEIHKFINSEFRNYRLRLEWPLETDINLRNHIMYVDWGIRASCDMIIT